MQIKRGETVIDFVDSLNGNTTLFFIHGAFIDNTFWKSQINYFSEKYRIVAIDLPGHGKSGGNRDNYSIGEFGKDVIAVIDHLNLEKIILIGHSLGGDVALEVAVSLSEKVIGFIGVDTLKNAGKDYPEEIRTQVDELIKNLETNFPDTIEMYARLALFNDKADTNLTDRILQKYKSASPELGIAIMADGFNYWQREKNLLESLSVKLYLVNCDYIPTEEDGLKENLHSGFEVRDIHCFTHFPMIEKPDELNHMLESIIDSIELENASKVKTMALESGEIR